MRPTRGGKKKKDEEKRTNDAGDVMWGPDGGGTLAKRVMEGGGAAGMNERGMLAGRVRRDTHVVKVCVRGAMVRGAVVCSTSGCVIIT